MIRSSTSLIVTGSVLMDSTQASSHGAGHSVPVNSGKFVRGVQPIGGPLPETPQDQVVPLGDQISQWAARVAERHPTIHAPAGLQARLCIRDRLPDLPPVP
jgi:hypothetical protein